MVKFFSKYIALLILLFALPLVVCCGLENMLFDRHSEIKMVNNDEMSVLTCWLSESSNMQYHPYFNTSMELALDERCTRVDTGEKKTIMRLARIDAYESISFERVFEELGPQYLAVYKFHWGEYTEEDLLGIYELTLERIRPLIGLNHMRKGQTDWLRSISANTMASHGNRLTFIIRIGLKDAMDIRL